VERGFGPGRQRRRVLPCGGSIVGSDQQRLHFCPGDLVGIGRGAGDHLDVCESNGAYLVQVRLFVQRAGDTAGPGVQSVTTSEMLSRPPGRSTRKASPKTASLSGDRLMTQLEMITSTAWSGRGMSSISP